MAEVDHRTVFEVAAERILESYYKRRPGEAARWTANLIYYVSAEGLINEYVKLLDILFHEYIVQEPYFAVRFVAKFNDEIDKMRRGPEYAYVAKALEEVEKLKEGMMVPEVERRGYRVPRPPKDLKERVSRLVDMVMG